MKKRNSLILLTGASGQLGRAMGAASFYKRCLTPPRKELDITSLKSIDSYLNKHDIDRIIHTAALARQALCEEDPMSALDTNLLGTAYLVKAILRFERQRKHGIRFIYISTDGVYPGTEGHYSETSTTIPYNKYGWTKLGGECAVQLLSDFCIIRTRFFDPGHLKFDTCPVDSFTSAIALHELVTAIDKLLYSDFVGVVNVGGRRMSDYERYKAINPSLKPCRLKDIQREKKFKISRDSSFNTKRWRDFEKTIQGYTLQSHKG